MRGAVDGADVRRRVLALQPDEEGETRDDFASFLVHQGGVVEENVTTVNNYYGDSASQAGSDQDAGYQDTGVQDADYQDDSSFDDGGGFDSGTDV